MIKGRLDTYSFESFLALLIETDINAIDELVCGLVFYLDKQGKQEEIFNLFDHLSKTAPLPNFEERMLFWKALWYDFKLENTTDARKLLQDISVDKVSDIQLLQLYLQLFRYELSASRRFEIIDRILDGTKEHSQLLQYNTLKAIDLIMIGDTDKAQEIVEKAIQEYKPLPKQESNIYHLNMYARALATKWRLSREETDLNEALEYYEKISKERLTNEGKSAIHEEQATLYKDAAIYEKAISHYEKSIEMVNSESAIIHLAEVYIKCGQIDKGQMLLSGLKEESISETCMLEYLQVKGMIGLAEKNKEMVLQVVNKAKTLKSPNLYYQDIQNQLCIELLEMVNNINDKKQIVGYSSKLKVLLEKLQMFCQYLELKPNIFGIGVNLNKIIGQPKDGTKKREK